MKTCTVSMRQDRRKICNFLVILCLILFVFVLNRMKALYCSSPYGPSLSLFFPSLSLSHSLLQSHFVFTGIPNALLQLELTRTAEENQLTEKRKDKSIEEDEDNEEKPETYPKKPICYETNKRSDTCDARGDLRVQGNRHSIFVNSTKQEWKLKPYARKNDHMGALSHVSEWSLKPFGPQIPSCTVTQTVPAVIFSVRGYTGNLFHDFTEVLIPLFITSHQFHGQVQLLVTDNKTWWVNKYKMILKQLSGYEVIDLDSDNRTVRCFPRVIIGLHFHKELGVDPSKSPTGYSVLDFKVLLRKAFGLERASTLKTARKPRLLIISRKHSRRFANEKEIGDMASSLGFEVVVGEADSRTDVTKFARLVNSADVLVGVHGAGLTNMVYLPSGAVVIQVVPFGGLDWLAMETFHKPSKDLELKYLEYRIQMEESTLIDEYPRGDPVLEDPKSVHKKGWNAMKEVYLVKQNVRPHLGRLKETFLEALKLLSSA